MSSTGRYLLIMSAPSQRIGVTSICRELEQRCRCCTGEQAASLASGQWSMPTGQVTISAIVLNIKSLRHDISCTAPRPSVLLPSLTFCTAELELLGAASHKHVVSIATGDVEASGSDNQTARPPAQRQQDAPCLFPSSLILRATVPSRPSPSHPAKTRGNAWHYIVHRC